MADVASKSIKALVGRKVTKTVAFCGGEVEIQKLSVAQVQEIQAKAKENENNDEGGLEMLRAIVSLAVEGGSELSADDFSSFPIDELKNLSDTIMEHSGLSQGNDEAGKSA